MTNKSGTIGTKTETAVVRAILPYWPSAERRRLRGRFDFGDITGTPGVCWEVKGGAAAKGASDGQIVAWLEETELERINSSADVGVLVVPRRGIGAPNAGRWYAIVTAARLSQLVSTNHRYWPLAADQMPARLYLDDMCQILVAAGYGSKPEAKVA